MLFGLDWHWVNHKHVKKMGLFIFRFIKSEF